MKAYGVYSVAIGYEYHSKVKYCATALHILMTGARKSLLASTFLFPVRQACLGNNRQVPYATDWQILLPRRQNDSPLTSCPASNTCRLQDLNVAVRVCMLSIR